MSQASLERRVAALEKQVAQLMANGVVTPPRKDWRRTVGMFAGDEMMKRIDEAGQAWREQERRKSRRRSTRRQRTKA